MNTVITLLGSSLTKNTEGIKENLFSPSEGSESLNNFPMAREVSVNTSIYTKLADKVKRSVSISYSNGQHLLEFNLDAVSCTLVTVYDLHGKILDIQTFNAHNNALYLNLNNHVGNYLVRVRFNYCKPIYTN